MFYSILTLSKMPERRGHFSEIKRSIPGISQRMLTATLRNLERYGILQREIFAKLDPMKEIGVWIVGNWSTIRSSRTEFDNRLRLGK
ncbi:MAG: helix-turn-helix transcriptional regulator [Bacteriovorax sp.]|nr:helix-turn-helix transcriptional regulator [Bacteriovorax sp.]